MKSILSLLLLLYSYTTINAQSFEYSGDFNKDVAFLLPEGRVDFEIMNGVSMPDRLVKIIEKFTKALSENKEWFNQQVNKAIAEDGEPMPYDKRMGITKEEYEYMVTKKFDVKINSTGQLYFDISYSKNKIYLKSSDTTDFTSIVIDLKSKKARINEKILAFDGPVIIESPDNVFNSSWRGYKWINEESSSTTIDFENIDNMVVKVYNITLGYIDASKQLYIDIKGGEFNKGEKTVDFKYRLLSK
ncbi:hypothetical protein [uncultured Dokdonia sp.]|uniref:hypothetical protein n=1 Tax=uncultured Dokdonia sp. TaxID=575653 RepID=UPI00260C715F|nr:hypothetical protein [uncultured Dokdonia sp.]